MYLTDEPGRHFESGDLMTPKDYTGLKLEFEDYAVLLFRDNANQYCGTVLDGMSWGFQQAKAQITEDTTNNVYTMLPFKALGRQQSGEFKTALESYSRHYQMKIILYK